VVYNSWQTYLAKERCPTLPQIARVLVELGTRCGEDSDVYEIHVEDLRQYAQAHSYPRKIEDLIDYAYAKLSASRGAVAN
jgi:hypothetical protein